MKYGFVFPGGEARTAADLARAAEAAGWDGFFVPDAVWWHDPWVTLAACAMCTERIRLGTMITPVSRRRPWNLAAQTATLDRLSNGRVILAVGMGAPTTGFAEFGETEDRRTRAELLDEGLDIIAGLWSGHPIEFDGKHYHVRKSSFPPCPPPVQTPRIPVWVVGAWPRRKSMDRAARWDGLLPNKIGADGKHARVMPADLREMQAYVEAHRTATTPFDIVIEGETPGASPKKDASLVQPWIEAGATWWLDSMWSNSNDLARVRKRIEQGPPRV